jgi:hypothetical protein
MSQRTARKRQRGILTVGSAKARRNGIADPAMSIAGKFGHSDAATSVAIDPTPTWPVKNFCIAKTG